ncbi:hypothetical protein LINPERHAP2_LOCUS10827 [Linum perenne]
MISISCTRFKNEARVDFVEYWGIAGSILQLCFVLPDVDNNDKYCDSFDLGTVIAYGVEVIAEVIFIYRVQSCLENVTKKRNVRVISSLTLIAIFGMISMSYICFKNEARADFVEYWGIAGSILQLCFVLPDVVRNSVSVIMYGTILTVKIIHHWRPREQDADEDEDFQSAVDDFSDTSSDFHSAMSSPV